MTLSIADLSDPPTLQDMQQALGIRQPDGAVPIVRRTM